MCTSPQVATYAELMAGGWRRRAVESAVRGGSLVRLRRGIYATPSACGPLRTAAAHGGALACVTAARHLGLWVLCEDDSVHVWMRGSGHSHHHGSPDCTCIEHWDAGPASAGLGAPSVPRVLRQILACFGVEDFFVAVESALRLRLLDRSGIEWLRDHTNEAARTALAYTRDDADSGLESLVRWRLRHHGLEVRTQVSIPSTGRVDLLIGDRLIVEADGRGNHHGADHRHKDLVRDAHAAMWGYSTLRFDYALIVHDWDLVERAILGRLRPLR